MILGGPPTEAIKGKELGGCRRGNQGVMSLVEGHGDQWSLVECLERRPRGMLLGEGHGEHLKAVDWKRGRGLADGYLRAANRWQSRMYGLKTGGAEWLQAGQAKVNGYSGVRRAYAKIDHGSR